MTRSYRRGDGAKRAFDVVAAAAALVAASPVLAATAVVVRVRLGKPVLFRHVRPGRDGIPFTMLKFRTMSDARDAAGALLPDADRLTSLGRFLRASSIDELPELVNVLRGEMSIVGPRPLLTEYLDRYTPEQMRRHDVRPGVTGLVQVSGRNALSWDEKFALDVWYVDHRTFLLDLRIIARTVAVVLRPQGVSRPGHATMPNFQGSARRDCDGPDGRDAASPATRSMP
jgi:lipopolysaccharide/colanic/teichoic acid biosynthesis glycosyltransferase